MNNYHQLGQTPSPDKLTFPKILPLHKTNKDLVFIGIGAAKYHSVIWTKNEIFTFGLNAGQLGHFYHDNEKTIQAPRKVTSIVLKDDTKINCVGISDGATVISTTQGNVYVLHQYQTRQAASKVLGILKIECVGGRLNSKIGAEGLTEDGGCELKFVILTTAGHIYLWTEDFGNLRRCIFSLPREILITDFCFNHQMIVLTTNDGEAFKGIILANKTYKHIYKSKNSFSNQFMDSIDKSARVVVKLTRLQFLHRTVSVFSDPKGHNFIALQDDPRIFSLNYPDVSPSTMKLDFCKMFEEISEFSIPETDTIISTDNQNFHVHSAILAQRSEYFLNRFYPNQDSKKKVKLEFDQSSPIIVGNKPYKFDFDMPSSVMKQLICFMYCGKFKLDKITDNSESVQKKNLLNGNDVDIKKSALSIYNNTNQSSKKKKEKILNIKDENMPKSKKSMDPIKIMNKYAKKFGVKDFDNFNGSFNEICYTTYIDNSKDLKFFRSKFNDLSDITIVCENGGKIDAHKIVLVARLEYFRAMLGSSWLETSGSVSIQVPVNLMEIIIEYLYTDDCLIIRQSNDIDLLTQVMVVADQFLIERLKEICEVRLAQLVSLKNVSELFCFATSLNANQLKKFTMQFICLNLGALVECNSLQNLPSCAIKEFSDFYRSFVPQMACRMITPYMCEPSSFTLQQVLEENPIEFPLSDEEWENDLLVNKDQNGKQVITNLNSTTSGGSSRKKKRSHRQSEGRSRKTSTSSQISSASEGDITKDLEQDFESLSFDDLQEWADYPNKMSNSYTSFVDDAHTNDKNDRNKSWVSTSPIAIPSSNTWKTVKKRNSINEDFEPVAIKTSPIPTLQNTDANSVNATSPSFSPNPSLPKKVEIKNQFGTRVIFPSLNDSLSLTFTPLGTTSPKQDPSVKTKTGKLSQKQRKKLAADALNHGSNSNSVVTSPKGWGVVDNSNPIKGFASIVKQEEALLNKNPNNISKNINGTIKSKEKSSNFPTSNNHSKGWNSPPTPDTPKSWSAIDFAKSPEFPLPQEVMPSPCFSMILQEEKLQKENLQKEMAKPLSLIQLEDKAIEELLEFYGAENNPEEKISVFRVKRNVADPTWNK